MVLRPEVQAFAELMESKLIKHDSKQKDRWKVTSEEQLEKALRRKVEEAVLSNKKGDWADVANFAMFLSYRSK